MRGYEQAAAMNHKNKGVQFFPEAFFIFTEHEKTKRVCTPSIMQKTTLSAGIETESIPAANIGLTDWA